LYGKLSNDNSILFAISASRRIYKVITQEVKRKDFSLTKRNYITYNGKSHSKRKQHNNKREKPYS